ncbi:PqqD family peptide modification chaperone [Halomonas sp. TRM85114]|nr:PqqD family peptide modification chaperone [Halomonas jincaotanensis]
MRVLKDVAEAPLAPDWLVQEYMANPHTIRGHKYVLRLYVLIAALEPLRVYRYRQGFAKLASEPWDPEDADNPFSQLTNPDINALNVGAEVPVEFIDLDRYRQWLRDQGHDDEALFARIEDLIALTMISAVDAMRRRTAQAGADPHGCYELLGLDCLVDDTLTPWLLECNLSPSLGICAAPETGGRVEEAVKGGLVHDLVALVDIPGHAMPRPVSSGQDPDDSAWLVAETRAEQARAGGFLPLLPAAEPERYLPYFTLPSLADLQLAEGLTGRPLARPRLQRRHVAEVVEEERLALYATRSGRYYRPNDTAALIWLLATDGLAPDAIADELVRATAETGTPPDAAALRRDVWTTLGDWCREGLLCQQGDPSAAIPTAPETHVASAKASPARPAMRLSLAGRGWALEIASGPAEARLTTLMAGHLAPLDERGEETRRLPRLAVLRETLGYALAADDRLVASRLTLAQLGPVLLGHLIRQAAMPGRPVIDAGLLITPGGSGVLCLLPEGEASRTLLARRVSASGGALTRGVRLDLSDPQIAEPLGFPVPGVGFTALEALPSTLKVRGVLMPYSGSADAELTAATTLEALGALLPRCLTADGEALDAEEVSSLGEWLAGLAHCAVALGEDTPSSASLAEWLSAYIEPATPSTASALAMAKG